MSIPLETSITLDIHSPKKDAVVATGAPTVGDNDVALYVAPIPDSTDELLTQSTVGDFRKLLRYALSTLSVHTGAVALEIPMGGGDNDIQTAVPTAGSACLYVGADLVDGGQSHYIDRTFKRLIERWLEEAK